MPLVLIRKFERSVPSFGGLKGPSYLGKLTTASKVKILKPITVAVLPLALGIASFLFPLGAFAADAANDSPGQSTPIGFSPWVTDQFGIVVGWDGWFLINNGAWLLPIPFDAAGSVGFNAAMRGFTGDEYLDVGQTFSTSVLFSSPGTGTTTRTPTEGIDFFAQGGGRGNYEGFGHQVLGIYLTGNLTSGPTITVVAHTTISDEHPEVVINVPIGSVFNVGNPQPVTISLTQHARGHWVLRLGNAVTLTSSRYGTTWNKGSDQGVDGVRYFTSQGTNSSGPLRWMNMSVK